MAEPIVTEQWEDLMWVVDNDSFTDLMRKGDDEYHILFDINGTLEHFCAPTLNEVVTKVLKRHDDAQEYRKVEPK